MNALVDTGLLLDYLRGDTRAREALHACTHRSVTVSTWVEVMRACPPDRREATRAWLRGFERLSISESTADEAMRLSFDDPRLDAGLAVNLASAIVNQLVFVTTHPAADAARRDLVVPYRSG